MSTISKLIHGLSFMQCKIYLIVLQLSTMSPLVLVSLQLILCPVWVLSLTPATEQWLNIALFNTDLSHSTQPLNMLVLSLFYNYVFPPHSRHRAPAGDPAPSGHGWGWWCRQWCQTMWWWETGAVSRYGCSHYGCCLYEYRPRKNHGLTMICLDSSTP